MRKWLREIRKERGMTEGNVADAVRISQAAYHWFETGARTPRPETAKKIAAVLGFPWPRFYEDDPDEGEEDNDEAAAE